MGAADSGQSRGANVSWAAAVHARARSGRLWSVQVEAIRNTERSLREDGPRALIQMATGSGKTFNAANLSYRLIKHAMAKRILFLVDRSNLGE